MKKLTAFSIGFVLLANICSAVVIKTKSHGGFFGYKYIDQTSFNNGTTYLSCSDPGFSRCTAIPVAIAIGSPILLTDESSASIENRVMQSINEQNTKGKILFDNSLVIKYHYNVKNDRLRMEIYTLEEALSKGII